MGKTGRVFSVGKCYLAGGVTVDGGVRKSGWCAEVVYARNDLVVEGNKKMDVVRGWYLSGMSHSGWKETGKMDGVCRWYLPRMSQLMGKKGRVDGVR